jgi:hypothetical protein
VYRLPSPQKSQLRIKLSLIFLLAEKFQIFLPVNEIFTHPLNQEVKTDKSVPPYITIGDTLKHWKLLTAYTRNALVHETLRQTAEVKNLFTM